MGMVAGSVHWHAVLLSSLVLLVAPSHAAGPAVGVGGAEVAVADGEVVVAYGPPQRVERVYLDVEQAASDLAVVGINHALGAYRTVVPEPIRDELRGHIHAAGGAAESVCAGFNPGGRPSGGDWARASVTEGEASVTVPGVYPTGPRVANWRGTYTFDVSLDNDQECNENGSQTWNPL